MIATIVISCRGSGCEHPVLALHVADVVFVVAILFPPPDVVVLLLVTGVVMVSMFMNGLTVQVPREFQSESISGGEA
jgi:hypothetical protein